MASHSSKDSAGKGSDEQGLTLNFTYLHNTLPDINSTLPETLTEGCGQRIPYLWERTFVEAYMSSPAFSSIELYNAARLSVSGF